MSGETNLSRHHPKGRIEVVCGPMFGGKTEELIRRIRRAEIARRPVVVFKPETDTRSGECLRSHSKMEWPAINIPSQNPWKILDHVGDAHVVGIEEVQFFHADIVKVTEELARQGIRVVVAGLDMDAWGQPFGVMPALMAVAERVDKLTAICSVCGEDATRSQKLVSGGGQVEIGAADKYAPRCREHFSPAPTT